MADVDPEVRALIDSVENPVRRRDAETLVELMARITGKPARIAYRGIVGFGTYHYRYASGREGDAPGAAFSPRKPATTIYLNDGIEAHADELERLGPHTTGVGCLYVKDLDTVDLAVLERVVRSSYEGLTAGTFGQRAREGGSPAVDERPGRTGR
jgi:hypothetical protein